MCMRFYGSGVPSVTLSPPGYGPAEGCLEHCLAKVLKLHFPWKLGVR